MRRREERESRGCMISSSLDSPLIWLAVSPLQLNKSKTLLISKIAGLLFSILPKQILSSIFLSLISFSFAFSSFFLFIDVFFER